MRIKSIFKGTVFALIITMLVIIGLSLASYFFDIDSKSLTIGVYGGVAAGVFMGSLIAAKSCHKSVLLHSMAVSLIYLFILVGVSALINKTIQFNAHFITMTLGILASGFLGAIIGK